MIVWEGGLFTYRTMQGRGRPSPEEGTPFASADFEVPTTIHGRQWPPGVR